ncbi:hypothetical protein OAB57_03855, partial [Bacteriovoracaceae bacterium]|nr:hypothetical protein [Bacteriovoracaceae bacterium]
TKKKTMLSKIKASQIKFPLTHPQNSHISSEFDKLRSNIEHQYFSILRRIVNRLRKSLESRDL